MQLLYGNDGVNYRVIDKSAEMTEGVQRTLLSSYSRYDFVSDPKVYHSVDQEPEAITYVTSSLDNTLKGDQVIICKTGHMQNYYSPSYYFHGLVKEVPENFYEKDFFELFGYQFIPDVEADVYHYSGGKVDSYRFPVEEISQKALTKEQLIVILASFMANDKRGKKTKIISDVSGKGYNHRSREILASIYHYLPYELRKRYGFKSYSQNDINLPARVSFVVFPKEEVKAVSGFITLKETRHDIAQVVEKEYLDYAIYLVEGLDDISRKEHFKEMSRLANNGYLRIKDCVDYYNNQRKWSQGSQEDLLPEWITYIDQNSFRKGPLYELLLKIIVTKVDNDYYNDYLFDQTLRLYRETIYQLSPQAAKVMRFADCLEEIYIEPARFHDWYQEQLQSKINSLPPEKRESPLFVKNFYEEEIKIISQINIRCDELIVLLENEINQLKVRIRDNIDAVDRQKDQESDYLNKRISQIMSVSQLASMGEELSSSIQFEENRVLLQADIIEWLEDHMPDKISTKKELLVWKEGIDKLGTLLPEETRRPIRKKFDEWDQDIVQKQRALTYTIEAGKVLGTFKDLMLAFGRGLLEPGDKVQVNYGNNVVTMEASALEEFLTYIIYPEDESVKNYSLKPEDQKSLIKQDLIRTEHMRSLLGDVNPDEESICGVVQYYLNDCPERISGTFLAEMLYKYHPDIAEHFYQEYEASEEEEARFFTELGILLGLESEDENPFSRTKSKNKKGKGKAKGMSIFDKAFGRK